MRHRDERQGRYRAARGRAGRGGPGPAAPADAAEDVPRAGASRQGQQGCAHRPPPGRRESGRLMNFSSALAACKTGCKVARTGWNGKGMFIYLVPGSQFQVNRPPLLGIYPEGTTIDYLPHIDIKTADGSCVPWLASQTDLLADDWTFSCDDGLCAKEPGKPDLPSATVTYSNVTVSAQGGTALTGTQIRELTETIQTALLQQAKRGRATGIKLPVT